jgi:hypothetical protein
VSIQRISIGALAAHVRELPEKRRQAAIQAIRNAVKMRGEPMIQTAIDAVRPHPPVNTGDYRRRWRAINIPDGARLQNSSAIAGVIEHGRRPGKGVSREGIEALMRWAHLHGMAKDEKVSAREGRRRSELMTSAKALGRYALMMARAGIKERKKTGSVNTLRSVAFAIASAIKRRGLPAKHVLASIAPTLSDFVRGEVQSVLRAVS